MPHISIKAERIFEIFGFPVTNSYLTSLIVIVLFFIFCLYYKNQLDLPIKKRSRLALMILFICSSLYKFFGSVLGEKIKILFPAVSALFVFILLQNWFGLIPGVGSLLIGVKENHEIIKVPLFRGATADLNMTLALGLMAFFLVQYYGVYFIGFKNYIGKFFNFRSPIDFFIGILEIISEFSRVMSFSFRLFGNIFAGEVLLAIIAFLMPVLAAFPFLVLEIFVGFVQALVFSMLTSVFITVATSEHH